MNEATAQLTGGCNCGAVRFEVTEPLVSAEVLWVPSPQFTVAVKSVLEASGLPSVKW